MSVEISKYYQSFSGTDTLAFIMLPGCTPVCIGSLTTISYSMYRNKKPVINIGRTNINGVTRGTRIYAGTMIFTLINQHWLRELQEMPQASYLKNFKELKTDDMPLFDIMIISANEYGNAVKMFIWGIDITDEAQTISVEDMFTENVFSFIARDVSVFNKIGVHYKDSGESDNTNGRYDNENSQRYYFFDNSNATIEDIDRFIFNKNISNDKTIKQDRLYQLSRALYFKSTERLIGSDVVKVQTALNDTGRFRLNVNGIFDEYTYNAVREYQSMKGINPDGIVNEKLYLQILSDSNNIDNNRIRGMIINKSGAFIYRLPDINADIIDIKPYKDYITIKNTINNNTGNNFYEIDSGYIRTADVYTSKEDNNIFDYPILRLNDKGYPVTIIQNILNIKYGNILNVNGIYDNDTRNAILVLQKEYNINQTGIVDYSTWIILNSINTNLSNEISNSSFNIKYEMIPDKYNADKSTNINEYLDKFKVTIFSNSYINIKASVICYYKNNKSKTFIKNYHVIGEQKISLLDFQEALLYNNDMKNSPEKIEFIIYPNDKKAYKWIISF